MPSERVPDPDTGKTLALIWHAGESPRSPLEWRARCYRCCGFSLHTDADSARAWTGNHLCTELPL